MKRYGTILLVIVLAMVSALMYLIQYLLFHNPDDQAFYFFQDLGFMFIQVIVVTVIFNRLISILEQSTKLKNMNVLISAFFSETGNVILNTMSASQISDDQFCQMIERSHFKDSKRFKAMRQDIREYKYQIDVTPAKLEQLREILVLKRPTMLEMLGNAHLSEHDTFTDMLWSLFHVADELGHRDNLQELSQADLAHLKADVRRAYPLLIQEWVGNLKYLHDEYPYMFDSAIRFSPLLTRCRAELSEQE